MKRTTTLFTLWLLASLSLPAQSLLGAWETTLPAENGPATSCVLIVTDGYHATACYDTEGKFLHTRGGKWTMTGGLLEETVEFDSQNPERVGTAAYYKAILDGDSLTMDGGPTYYRIDDGSPGALAGAWLFSGRKQDGEVRTRDNSGPRKTMKILSGTRFQWIAYHTGTKEFLGTGGGTYTTEDGKYTEHIEFFSRDDSRAGASLAFDFELIDGRWHHSGLSSRGEPMYEVWSLRGE